MLIHGRHLILVVCAMFAQGALATTITISQDLNGDLVTIGGAPWQASCSDIEAEPCMLGLVGPAIASTSDSTATAYDQQGSPESELSYLNTLLGLTGEDLITGATDIAGSGSSFEATYQYFAIKQAPYIMYFENLAEESLEVFFEDEFSHVTGFGEQLQPPSEIPVPAAAWLFGSALVGLVAIGRRKKSL